MPTELTPPAAPLADRLETIALLAEPIRRALFLHVAGAAEPVSRDEAAAAVGISRPLAAFHLERLLEARLLEADFRRREDWGRRGRGRPTKLYRPANRQFDLSVPPRQYELAASLFTDALATIERPPALDEAARAHGRLLGARVRQRAGRRASTERLLNATEQVLAEQGFAPRRCEATRLCLANCPFDALAKRHRDLVCPTNLALVDGLLDGAGIHGVTAHLEPSQGRCCIVLDGGMVNIQRAVPAPADDGGRLTDVVS